MSAPAGQVTAFTVEQIARVVHAANREIQVITGDPAPSVPWESTPEDIWEVAIAGVRGALAGETPEESHAAWCRNLAAQGWRRGEFKDPAAKIHPCLVPYEDLPPEHLVKDAVFVAIVRAMSGKASAGPRAWGGLEEQVAMNLAEHRAGAAGTQTITAAGEVL